MKLEFELDQMLHLLWSHGDAIPKPVREHIANGLRSKLSKAQLKSECIRWCHKTGNGNFLIREGKEVGGPTWLFEKITEYVTTDTKTSRYVDLARG